MRTAGLFLAMFLVSLGAALWLPSSNPSPIAGLAAAFYQAGALVFGGGHVVLPLLQHTVVDSGWVDPDAFLAGYGAAQALPGPMFSLAAFLGAEVPPGFPAIVGGLVALLAAAFVDRSGPGACARRWMPSPPDPGSSCWRSPGCRRCGSCCGA